MNYNYEKPIKLDLLKKEIQDSSIQTALDYINQSGDFVDIHFKAALSTQDEQTLDAIIDAHDASAPFVGDPQSVEVINRDPDTNGLIISPKWAPDGWHQCLHETEFETSKLNSIHEKDHNGDDLNWSTVKFYDSAMNELTTQNAIDSDCVWSVYDWMPTMDYGIKAGQVSQLVVPENDIYFWAIGLPDVMPKLFADGGINLKFVDARDPIGLSGVAATVLPYNGGVGTNKIRFKFYHPAGLKHRIQLIWEIFRA
jgi:hypothetical protein